MLIGLLKWPPPVHNKWNLKLSIQTSEDSFELFVFFLEMNDLYDYGDHNSCPQIVI